MGKEAEAAARAEAASGRKQTHWDTVHRSSVAAAQAHSRRKGSGRQAFGHHPERAVEGLI